MPYFSKYGCLVLHDFRSEFSILITKNYCPKGLMFAKRKKIAIVWTAVALLSAASMIAYLLLPLVVATGR